MPRSRASDEAKTSSGWTLPVVVVALISSAGIWAGISKLPEVASGPAKVVPARPMQIVQSEVGGRVRSLLVREGETVAKGAEILTITNTSLVGEVRAMNAKRARLVFTVARLRSEAESRQPKWPAKDIGKLPEGPSAAVDVSVIGNREAVLLERNTAARRDTAARLRAETTQVRAELAEAKASMASGQEILDLLQQEQQMNRAAGAAASRTKLLEIARAVADQSGTISEAKARLGVLNASLVKSKAAETAFQSEWRAKVLADLVESEEELAVLTGELATSSQRLRETRLVSPTRGIVQTVHVPGDGAVVRPGDPLVEIVPLTEELLVEVRIPTHRVAGIRPGMPAHVKIDAFDFARFGALAGDVVHVSPDAIEDRETREAYFRVRVRTERAAFETVDEDGKPVLKPVIPGMTGSGDIVVGRRTVLDYLVTPMTRVAQTAFRD